MVQREWKSPSLPDDPLEKLVAMGFANRELNKQLMQKHNNQLQVPCIIFGTKYTMLP